MKRALLFVALVLLGVSRASADSQELCYYLKSDGSYVQVRDRSEIPSEYEASAHCIAARAATSNNSVTGGNSNSRTPAVNSDHMAQPGEVTLHGPTGHAELATALGPIDLRWPRAVEELFGRNPERAMGDAANAVGRALRTGDFPSSVQALNQTWNVVFMDENMSNSEIPMALLTACHPGWMLPPANIYIVAQRAARQCSGGTVSTSEADARLATILVHEMGHAVEFRLLPMQFSGDRMRAEGFAAWFEQYASGYSSVMPQGRMRSFYGELARSSFRNQPTNWVFMGSAEDYARASMYFNAIVSRHGVAGLVDVYQTMQKTGLAFFPAVQQQFGWDQKKFDQEAQRVAQ